MARHVASVPNVRRITLPDFIRVSWKEARWAVGIFAVETIIRADSVETLTIHGKPSRLTFYVELTVRGSEELFSLSPRKVEL